jgi:hypothetical protein
LHASEFLLSKWVRVVATLAANEMENDVLACRAQGRIDSPRSATPVISDWMLLLDLFFVEVFAAVWAFHGSGEGSARFTCGSREFDHPEISGVISIVIDGIESARRQR